MNIEDFKGASEIDIYLAYTLRVARVTAKKPLIETHKCNTHPNAPHGFLRNASHNEGRYVCECEHWKENT
jgi:hypothetical protein